MIAVEVIDTLERMSAIGDEWNTLADQCQSPLLDHDWCLSSAEALHRSDRLQVVAIREDGALVGVAPLVVESGPSGAHLTILGASRLYEPGGWLSASDRALDTLIDAVLRLGRPILLHRVSVASALCAKLSQISRHKAVTVVRSSASSLAVRTDGARADHRRGLSSTITGNLPRVRRKAERTIGPVTITRVNPKPEEVDAIVDSLAAVEDSGWKGERGSSLIRQPDLQNFFRRYSRRAAVRGRLCATTLTFGDTVAAVELAIQACRRHWQLKIAYLDRLSQYYPGLQLVDASIDAAFEARMDAYEFLGSAERWEEAWRPEVREYRLMAAYPLTVAGIVGACGDVASAVWRKTRTTLPRASASEQRL